MTSKVGSLVGGRGNGLRGTREEVKESEKIGNNIIKFQLIQVRFCEITYFQASPLVRLFLSWPSPEQRSIYLAYHP